MFLFWFVLSLVIFDAIASAQVLPNAVPMPTPEIQYLDQNGVPLSGAYLCTYAAGTSTPQATYTDNTAGTPNTNPIVLDTAGRASVWVGPLLYKFVLRTGGTGNSCSTGSVVWTQDMVGDTTLYFVNYVKSIGTSNLITYTSALTGGVSRTQFAKDADVTSVKDFGAVGDGSTDDTAAINLAMAQSSLSLCVFFPDGVYAITSALSYTHPVCMVGGSWRLKYTGVSTIASVLALVGDPVNTYGSHGTHMEGSIVIGAIVDGQGHATNGLTLQGVVSSHIERMRATNVTGAGLMCNWCQQTDLNQFMVSADFETFTTTPTNGLVIDNISSDNYITNVNIDHVSGDGIAMKYALNTTIIGGTSEGNGGYGVNLTSGASPFRNSFNNAIEQFDVEVNTLGDFCFCDTAGNGGVFNNSIFQANSFSVPGITFSGSAHNNGVYGGEIGGGSTASAGTYGNSLNGVGCVAIADPCWTDSGQNANTTMRNQSTGTVTPAADNYNATGKTFRFNSVATFSSQIWTPSATYSEFRTGATTGPWMAMATQTGLAAWLVFPGPAPGMQFISEATYRGAATPQGSIVAGNWGFGTYNTQPPAKFHFQDSNITRVVFQAAPGQAFADITQTMAYQAPQDTLGTIMAREDYQGIRWGPVAATGLNQTIPTYSTLGVLCASGTQGLQMPITDSPANTWGTVVSAGGGSYHVLLYCDGTAWSVMAK